jgi:hypothetical protein
MLPASATTGYMMYRWDNRTLGIGILDSRLLSAVGCLHVGPWHRLLRAVGAVDYLRILVRTLVDTLQRQANDDFRQHPRSGHCSFNSRTTTQASTIKCARSTRTNNILAHNQARWRCSKFILTSILMHKN